MLMVDDDDDALSFWLKDVSRDLYSYSCMYVDIKMAVITVKRGESTCIGDAYVTGDCI